MYCKDHLLFCGFIRTASLCVRTTLCWFDKDHPLFVGLIRTTLLCFKDHLYFSVIKNRGVTLKLQGGPTKTNSQNMLSNLDHSIILPSICRLLV